MSVSVNFPPEREIPILSTMRNGPNKYNRTLGKAIRAAREERKLSQHQLAGKAGIGRASLSNYERGDRPVPVQVLEKISISLGVKPGYFFPAAENSGDEAIGAAVSRHLKVDQIRSVLPNLDDAALDMILTVLKLSGTR